MSFFFEDFDIAIYADDSTPYYVGKFAELVFSNLEQSSKFSLNGLTTTS